MAQPSIFGTLELPPDTSIDFTKPGDVSNWHDYFLRQRAMVSEIITVLESVTNNVTNIINTGGGTPLKVEDEGVVLTTKAKTMNFAGAGVVATAFAPDEILVTIAASASGGGFLKSDEFTASGTWVCPTGVEGAWLTMIAGGASGSATITAGLGGGAGGGGEYVTFLPVRKLVPGNSYTVTIGAGGVGLAAGLAVATAGNPGGDTRFDQFYVRGGLGAAATNIGGVGGGTRGGTVPAIGAGIGNIGTASTPNHFGGTSGSAGGNTTSTNGGVGAGSGGFLTGGAGGVAVPATLAGGGGAAATLWGIGGPGGNGGAAGGDAPAGSYGAGGGGAGGKAGTPTVASGAGMSGYVLIQYVA